MSNNQHKNGARRQRVRAKVGRHLATRWFLQRVKRNRVRDRIAKLARRRNRTA